MHSENPKSSPTVPSGIHISRVVTPRIPAGDLVVDIGADDEATGTVRLELQLDTCIHWLEIAINHLIQARNIRDQLMSDKATGATSFPGIDKELKACVQATVAAATFFEALYAAVLERMLINSVSKGPSVLSR